MLHSNRAFGKVLAITLTPIRDDNGVSTRCLFMVLLDATKTISTKGFLALQSLPVPISIF